MQGNLFPGALMRLSLVPPCLKIGTNFGLTAFVAALHRCAKLGKLGTTVVRQTDSGSDNDSRETHALHCALIHYGVVQKMIWIRLMPKHFHNLSDRVNSMVGEKIAPERGMGGGCDGPWEMEHIVKRALASQSGEPELAWHWCNWDRREWLAGHIQRELKEYSHTRYWVYDNCPNIEQNGGLKVTYKSNLLPHESGSREPEFKPVETALDGVTLQAKASGQDIMVSYPDLHEAAPVEPWKHANAADAEGVAQANWGTDKVFSDVIHHTTPKFTPEVQAQWKALRAFHDSFQSSDTVPSLPISVNEFAFKHGVPLLWGQCGRTWHGGIPGDELCHPRELLYTSPHIKSDFLPLDVYTPHSTHILAQVGLQRLRALRC
eukprot:4929684-Pleurochrysis_carterae.AAC.2